MDSFSIHGGRHAVRCGHGLSAGKWLDDSEVKEGGGGTWVEVGGGRMVEEVGIVLG